MNMWSFLFGVILLAVVLAALKHVLVIAALSLIVLGVLKYFKKI